MAGSCQLEIRIKQLLPKQKYCFLPFLLFKKKCFHNGYFFSFENLAPTIASKTDIPQIQGTSVTLVAAVTIIIINVPLLKSFATCWQETKYSKLLLQSYVYLDKIEHFLWVFSLVYDQSIGILLKALLIYLCICSSLCI